MHNHFDKFLNLKKIILERRPSLIVECGAGQGDLTKLIAGLLNVYEFEFHVISDCKIEELDLRIKWHDGLSYKVLEEFPKDSIGLCIIDTDHNYWTLMKEFAALLNRIKEEGLIALHDVVTFYHDTGMALSYWNDMPYPKEEIEKFSPYGSLGTALIDFLHYHRTTYRLLNFNPESHGAALLEKRTKSNFNIMTPGPNPIFAKKDLQEVA